MFLPDGHAVLASYSRCVHGPAATNTNTLLAFIVALDAWL
jgi:hypothetical protein